VKTNKQVLSESIYNMYI